jgi:hypothetical protein
MERRRRLNQFAHRIPAPRTASESLEPRLLFATTVLYDGFEGSYLNGWTNKYASGSNVSVRWGVNSVRHSAGLHGVFASALAGGVTAYQGYQNNQGNSLVRSNVSLAGYKYATLSFDYFLNSEAGYDTFSVAVTDRSNAQRTVVFTESGNFAASGFRKKTLDLSAFAGKAIDLEFRFDSDSSVNNEGGGVWLDEVKLTADTSIPPGKITGKLFNDANNNKLKDSTEGIFSGWTVYLDQNRNGIKDASERSTTSDASGNYTFSNLAPGTYYVEEVIPSGYAQTSPGAGGLSAGSGFKVNVNFPDGTLTAAQKTAFTDAATRWAQLIVGDVPDVNDGVSIIDDLVIDATAPSIDGRGGVLGQAAPTAFRTGSSLPFKGFMEFDAADLAQLQADGQLTRVILHEMGHVLGFGTIWDTKGLIAGAGTSDPRYTGPNALSQYKSIFSTTSSTVPLEGGGGAGTAYSHWRESNFANELMTGYLNGGTNPLSRVTAGAMADLGYAVSYSAADAYTRPASASLLTSGTSSSSYAAFASSALVGPFVKHPKTESFYGEVADTPVAVTEGNSSAALVDATVVPYAYTVYVDSGTTRSNVNFGARRTNKTPVITSVSDSPDNVKVGTTVTLTASGVSDPDGTVSKVSFYRDTNGVAGLQTGTGGDTLVATDTTGSDGYKATFSTSGLAAKAWTYFAVATDNAGATGNVVSCTNTLTASVSSTGSIAGTVFNDINGNAVRDSGDPALSGWRVFLDTDGDWAWDSTEKTVLSDASGNYAFTGLAAGTYNVRELSPSGWTRTAPSPTVTLASGQVATAKNFANFKLASIAGRVYADANRNSAFDTGDSGLSGVRVFNDANNNGLFDTGELSTTTDTSGNYTLGSLAAATRTIRIVAPSGRMVSSPSVRYYILKPTSGQAITGKNFATVPATSVKTTSLVLADEGEDAEDALAATV